MADHFEDRHRELRAGVHAAAIGGGYTTAQDKLDNFDERTGPLVDDLVAAVRGMLSTPIGGPLFIEKALRLIVPLEALDEASSHA